LIPQKAQEHIIENFTREQAASLHGPKSEAHLFYSYSC